MEQVPRRIGDNIGGYWGIGGRKRAACRNLHGRRQLNRIKRGRSWETKVREAGSCDHPTYSPSPLFILASQREWLMDKLHEEFVKTMLHLVQKVWCS